MTQRTRVSSRNGAASGCSRYRALAPAKPNSQSCSAIDSRSIVNQTGSAYRISDSPAAAVRYFVIFD